VDTMKCEVYFHSITGQRLARYSCNRTDWDDGSVRRTSFFTAFVDRTQHIGGQLTSWNGTGTTTDRLGSIRAKDNGERYTYYPYGETHTATVSDGGMYAALETPLRKYDSNSGRFDRPDPLGLGGVSMGDPGSWNRFAYAGGDPVNFMDPMGLFTVSAGAGTWSGTNASECISYFASLWGNQGTGAFVGSGSGGIQAINMACMMAATAVAAIPADSGSSYEPPKRRTYFLMLSDRQTSDCYRVPTNGGAVTRDISYELRYLEEGMSTPMFTNQGVIWEHLSGLGSLDKPDSPSSGAPGTFPDQQSIAGIGTAAQSGTQRFTAALTSGISVNLAIAAFGGTVNNPIGQLNIQKYGGYISINGNIGGKLDGNGRLIPGTYTPCPD
jgi:RHS repeat-associated protein